MNQNCSIYLTSILILFLKNRPSIILIHISLLPWLASTSAISATPSANPRNVDFYFYQKNQTENMSSTEIVLNALETQLSYRLEKLWPVFSWCSSILVSIIGVVLFVNHGGKATLSWQECSIISAVIILYLQLMPTYE